MNLCASEPKLPDVLGNQSVTLPAQSFLSDKRSPAGTDEKAKKKEADQLGVRIIQGTENAFQR